MSNERECDRCVYSTRSGGCRAWMCNGTTTVDKLKKDTREDFWKKFTSVCKITETQLTVAESIFDGTFEKRYGSNENN